MPASLGGQAIFSTRTFSPSPAGYLKILEFFWTVIPRAFLRSLQDVPRGNPLLEGPERLHRNARSTRHNELLYPFTPGWKQDPEQDYVEAALMTVLQLGLSGEPTQLSTVVFPTFLQETKSRTSCASKQNNRIIA